MKTLTNGLAKGFLSAAAAGAMVASAASPAVARDRHDHDGISAGDVIAGALVIGGIAAVASAASNNNYDRGYDYPRAGYDPRRGSYGVYGGYDRNGGYYNNGNPRQAVEMCVSQAERTASRYTYGRADVTDIRDIDRNGRGYTVRGRIAVNGQARDWRNGDNRYGRGWGGDYRGWNDGLRGYDSGSFKCRVEYGRVVDIDFDGIRGL
ncbi:MAG: hypothetical protein ACKOQM_06055 [Novosphingobium sp.]